jgi:hypothetical protein
MLRGRVLPVVAVLLGTASRLAAADACRLEPGSVARGAKVAVTVPGAAASGTLQFTPVTPYEGTSSEKREAPLTLSGGSAEYAVTDLLLGRYAVSFVEAGKPSVNCGSLAVTLPPQWILNLQPFEPDGTDRAEPLKVGDKELNTVALTLRGAGFVTDVPEDNRVFVNGTRVPVVKAGCSGGHPTGVTEAPQNGSGRSGQPSMDTARAEVLGSDRIELCGIQAKSRGEVLRVAVAVGDRLSTPPQEFRVYPPWSTVAVAAMSAGVALFLGFVVLGLVEILKRSKGVSNEYNVLKVLFLDPETDTYSLSKFQFYCWTAAAAFGYVYLVIGRMLVQGQSWPDMPATLPAVIGVGAGTAIGAQLVTNVRGPKGGGGEEANLGDLVTSGGVAAPERVQMFVWTILGVAAFCLSVVQHTPGSIKDLDKVPDGLMYLMGLSSLGYLGGKLARKPGPIINEISITPADSDEAIARAAALPATRVPNLLQPAAEAGAVLDTLTNAIGKSSQDAVKALAAAVAATSGVKTAADAQALGAILIAARDQAEAAAQAAANEFAQPGAPDSARTSAETAQRAAAAIHELVAVVAATLGAVSPTIAGPRFTRVIELRGRNLSNQALFEIDGAELPFRMLQQNRDGKQTAEVVIHEPDDPNLALVLRLSIDSSQLETTDLKQYLMWFGHSDGKKKTLTVFNPDGQKADITFTMPPGVAESHTSSDAQAASAGGTATQGEQP